MEHIGVDTMPTHMLWYPQLFWWFLSCLKQESLYHKYSNKEENCMKFEAPKMIVLDTKAEERAYGGQKCENGWNSCCYKG